MRLGLLATVTLTWVLLWGSATWANVLGGIAVAILVAAMVPTGGSRLQMRPLRLVVLTLEFTRRLVVASAVVAWEIVTPTVRIHQGILRVEVPALGDALTFVTSAAISLTPGTVVVDVAETDEHTVLYVHVLHLHDVEEVRADLLGFVSMIVAALGTPAPSDAIGDRTTGGERR